MKTKGIILLCMLLTGCSSYNPGRNISQERQKEYAAALYNHQLYIQAITEYSNLLNWYDLDSNTRANINHTIGNIFLEKLNDCTNALAYYMRVKHLYPKNSITEENNKNIVACFERLGRSAEAAEYLKGMPVAQIKSDSPFERIPGDTVAIVAGEVYTAGEIEKLFNYYYNSLSIEQRKKNPTRDDKLLFLREYIKSEVLYNSAKRQNLDYERDIIEVAHLLKKELMIKKLLDNDVYRKVTVNEAELEKYYEDNKNKYQTRTAQGTIKQLTYDEARDIVLQDLVLEKGKKLKGDLIDRLIEAQNAQVFPQKIQ